jgi:effector-binding domain-containing protein
MKYKIMVWWKKVLIVIGALLILFLILGIFMPKNVEVSQSRTINAPVQYVFNLLNNLKDSKQWNPFIMEDPDIELTYGQIWEGEGAQLTWKSSVVGNGSNIYTSSVKNQLIESDLLMEGMDTSFYAFQFKENEKKTTDLTWTMKSRLGFPYNALGFVFKYMIKKSYRKGLDNIEKVVAQRMNNKIYNGHKINESLITERNYALNRKVIKANEVRDFYSQSLGPIFQKIQSEGLTMTGKPVALYFNYDQIKQETDMAAGVPINIAREIKDLSFVNIAAQPAIQVDFTGDYSDLGPVHEAIKTYMMDRNLVKSGPAIEEYITDPIEEKDPKKYVTKIIYPFTTSK